VIGRRIPDIEALVAAFRLEAASAFAAFAYERRVAGMTYRQIADANGIHPSTVRRYVQEHEQRYESAQGLAPRSNAVPLTCPICDDSFTASRTDRRYCSNACRQDAYRRRKQGFVTEPREASA
jgi:predicted transcriptional regulator